MVCILGPLSMASPRNSAQALCLVLPCIQQEPDNSVVLAMSLCKDSPWTCISLSLQDCL